MRRLGVGLFLFVIGFSPRIPLGIPIPDRSFDLRIEDVLLVVLLVIWGIRLLIRGRPFIPSMYKVVATYGLIALLSSGIAILTLGLGVSSVVVYLGKEVEYFMLALLIANWV